MDANVIKNNTKVRTPDGLIGRIRVTDSALKLIKSGELLIVDVRANSRAMRVFTIACLEHVIRPSEEGYKEL